MSNKSQLVRRGVLAKPCDANIRCKEESHLPLRFTQLCANEEIILDPTDGLKTIAQADDVFESGIDPDFTNWNLDVPAQPTKATKVSLYQMSEGDGTFAEIFGGFGYPLEDLCLTQHQNIDFCMKHKDKLRHSNLGTFSLFKVGDKFVVTHIRMFTGGELYVYAFPFSPNNLVWHAWTQPCFVIPTQEQ